MEANLQSLLAEKEPGREHADLVQRLNRMVDNSRKAMSQYYPTWDRHDDIYRCVKPEGQDKQDRKAQERKEPEKMVVPIAHSQVQTFVAFTYSVLFQREYFFELTPIGADSDYAADVGEVLLQRDLDHSSFQLVCYQHLLDIARFGIGVMKETWVEETKYVTQPKPPTSVSLFGLEFPVPFTGGDMQKVKVPSYQGNKVTNVSPYRFFPDPALPISRFQEGEFVAFEDEYSYTSLKSMEANGVVAGIDFIPNIDKEQASQSGRKMSRLVSVQFTSDRVASLASQSQSAVVITEIVWNCIPANVKLSENITLGTETEPCKYLLWIANDNRIVKAEKFGHDHDTFPCSVGQFSPDIHHFLNEGLSGTIDVLQDVISWFVNSHITSVRKVIQNLLVVDPESIELTDLQERRSVIRTKPGRARLGIDKLVSQLNVSDVTQGHMEDAKTLQNMVQITTGISDAALGQFYTGRRSATEAKNVNTGTSSRLKMHAELIYYGSLRPLGQRMLSNLRQGLTMSVYVKIFGLVKDPMMKGYLKFAQVSKSDIQGELDFEDLDGTLPSEKQYQAQTLQEALQEMLAQPQLALMMGFDIKKVFFEILELRGIRHPERFMLEPAQQQAVQQAMLYQQQQAAQQGQMNGNQPAGLPPVGGASPSSGSEGLDQ